ncbi:MAG: glycosyl transferase [Candidatus Parcubacteria bacterium]|nr:MAG: glycosyl transferase [Candidatus Parcubacteria bacterium]
MSKYIFEISWEIANKVGGIYTVLATKAKYVKEFYGKNYFVIGPYLGAKSQNDFKILSIPREFENIIKNLQKQGIIVYYGEWLVEGSPHGFLIDFQRFLHEINSIKYDLWQKFGIDSLRTGKDYDEPVAWSKAVSLFIKELTNQEEFRNSIFHFHEWLAGVGLLLAKDITQKKIFTTHATVLGRSLASTGINFWSEISTLDPLKLAYDFHVEAKHLIEQNSAKFADILTTISSVTALEVEYFLKRKVDFILPNGIDLSKFPTFEEIATQHSKNRDSILNFILYFFSPYLQKHCPIRNSLIFFLSGRKEIKNKGFDIALLALGQLNKILKEKNIDINIYVFVFIPDAIIDVDHSILENLITYKGLENYLEDIIDEIRSRILHSLIHQRKIEGEKLLKKEELLEIQKILSKIKREKEAPLTTHLVSPDNEFLKLFRQAGLNNYEEDKVKVIFYPIYLSSTDGFLNLNYYDAINGCHLGIFPSFYEPWGYTPLETLAAGVMAITTDLTGFASYVEEKKLLAKESPGLWIIKRKNKKDEEVISELTQVFLKIATMGRAERIQNKYEARRLASHFDWRVLVKNYIDMYESKIF